MGMRVLRYASLCTKVFAVAQVKTPVTVRLNPDLLAEVRQSAARDNRSLTNFIETALRERINEIGRGRRQDSASARAFKDNKNL
jgi:hypothetical protein